MLLLFERRKGRRRRRLEKNWMMSCIYRYHGPEDGDNDVPEYLALTKVMMMMTMTCCTGIGG